MHCSHCGKSIHHTDIFCKYCGYKLSIDENEIKEELTLNYPSEISDLEFVFDGPAKKKGWLTKQVLQGFSVVFALKDKQGRLTSSSGEIELRVTSLCPDGFEKTFRIQVDEEDFINVWVQQSNESRREFFGYRFYYDKPELMVYSQVLRGPCEVHVELWFTTYQKRRLYAKNWHD